MYNPARFKNVELIGRKKNCYSARYINVVNSQKKMYNPAKYNNVELIGRRKCTI